MKQYVFVNKDLDWPVGSLAAQVAHASVGFAKYAYESGDRDLLERFNLWYGKHGQRTVVLHANPDEFMAAFDQFEASRVIVHMVREKGMFTAFAVEPLTREETPRWVDRYRLFDVGEGSIR